MESNNNEISAKLEEAKDKLKRSECAIKDMESNVDLTIVADATAVPSPAPTLTRDTKIDKDDIIPIEEDCFLVLSNGVRRRGGSRGTEHGSAASKAKIRAVCKIGQAIKQWNLSKKNSVRSPRCLYSCRCEKVFCKCWAN